MDTVTIHKAKSDLSNLVARAEAGEQIIIARGNKPAAKLVPLGTYEAKQHAVRTPGGWEHLIGKIPSGFFFDSLSDDELKFWEGQD